MNKHDKWQWIYLLGFQQGLKAAKTNRGRGMPYPDPICYLCANPLAEGDEVDGQYPWSAEKNRCSKCREAASTEAKRE